MPSSSTFHSWWRMASCFFLHLDFCWGTAARACDSMVLFDDEKIIWALSIVFLFKTGEVASGPTCFWHVSFWCSLGKHYLFSSVRDEFESWNLTFLTASFLENISNDNQDDGTAVTLVYHSFISALSWKSIQTLLSFFQMHPSISIKGLSVHLCLSVGMSVHPSLHPSASPFIHLYVLPTVCQWTFVHRPIQVLYEKPSYKNQG